MQAVYARGGSSSPDLIRLAVPDLKVGRLEELNPEESAVIFSGAPGRKDRISAVARERDLLEKAYMEGVTDGTTDFVILGFENQDYVDYALPVRVTLAEHAELFVADAAAEYT